MKICKAVAKTRFQHDRAYTEAAREKRIFFVITPKRKYAEIHYDVISALPEICSQLTEEGREKIKEIHQRYLAESKEKRKLRRMWVYYGECSGTLCVLKEDASRIADEVIAVLSNEKYHQPRERI